MFDYPDESKYFSTIQNFSRFLDAVGRNIKVFIPIKHFCKDLKIRVVSLMGEIKPVFSGKSSLNVAKKIIRIGAFSNFRIVLRPMVEIMPMTVNKKSLLKNESFRLTFWWKKSQFPVCNCWKKTEFNYRLETVLTGNFGIFLLCSIWYRKRNR